jgi:RimJ/RimL family protein N-acetyltransferase
MNPNFDFTQDYILEDEWVKLIPLQKADIEHLLDFSVNQPDLWKFSSLAAIGKENFTNYVNLALQNRSNKTDYPFAVFDKRTNEYAGSTRFYDIQPKNKSLQLGYTWYGEQFQGTGLNIHCKFLLLQFAFEFMEIERVEFRADNNNARSVAAMKSIGCKVDGILRKNMTKLDGGRRDTIVLSILREEWFAEVKSRLRTKLQYLGI